jgi:hypothetical protein
MDTKLKAVNEALLACGLPPVNTLEGGLPLDALSAKQILESEVVRILSKGWHFNLNEDVTLPRDAAGEIRIPPDYLQVDTASGQYVVRGSKLYDKTNNTYTLSEDVTCTVTLLLDYEALPPIIQSYIKASLNVRLQDRTQADETLMQTLRQELSEAQLDAVSWENENGDYRMTGIGSRRLYDQN